eukprot:CAMPEP_0177390904 /NCGR_PEP_ID=MMETSP0368-20130122/53460_1 /TAXON_ID=447022 ORGANISM="Scrippsiella hangoei-like, Strain SHHI-4" /NCGR_SAMPLE_ID=MMETSP0368 /ASSEMBLY_ACC=CAM_ASM_000363 /LENGTH=39 /DNA_ID= /DNA_START= /DNA_END= /DNA_ORIENTATION=
MNNFTGCAADVGVPVDILRAVVVAAAAAATCGEDMMNGR